MYLFVLNKESYPSKHNKAFKREIPLKPLCESVVAPAMILINNNFRS